MIPKNGMRPSPAATEHGPLKVSATGERRKFFKRPNLQIQELSRGGAL